MTERRLPTSLQIFLLLISYITLGFGQTSPAETGLAPSQTRQAASLPMSGAASASTQKPATTPSRRLPAFASHSVCAPCIRAHMQFLASDALRGRGSGTPDELIAATYIGAQLEQYGLQPAGDNGTFIQRAEFVQPRLKSAPTLTYQTPGDGKPAEIVHWSYGKEMLVRYMPSLKFHGPLKRVDSEAADPASLKLERGMVVLVLGKNDEKVRGVISAAMEQGAVAVLTVAPERYSKTWEERGKELPKPPRRIEGDTHPAFGEEYGDILMLSEDALAQLHDVPDGTTFTFEAEAAPTEKSYTWNAVGKIAGSDPALRASVILLTAHLDHLGVGAAVNGDSIYNGADDDASGTTAVLELARAIAVGPRPRRTVIFALFGSEEAGGLGSTWFREHPPVPLKEIAANLEFEMIGRPDPKYPKDVLWLTGWERSNLGPALAAHGAKLVADKRPEEQFFRRSDNYVLAKKGVVAQTVSSFGLHADYHQPSDDLAHIDFAHMTSAIGSLIRPVEWLLNSSFRPEWKAGGKP